MKFSTALFLASSFFVGSVHGLNEDTFALNKPAITKVDSDTMQVVFTNGEGADNTGATVKVITPGDCVAMGDQSFVSVTNGAITFPNVPGPTVVAISPATSPASYTTTYTFDIDVGSNLLDVTNDGTDGAELKLCVTHYFQADGGNVPNFQQTLLTINYDLSLEISSFTFLTAATDPDTEEEDIVISVTSLLCPGFSIDTPATQGEIVCVEICPFVSDSPNDSGAASDFFVSSILDVTAAMVDGSTNPDGSPNLQSGPPPFSFSQVLTDSSGVVTVSAVVEVTSGTGTASNCMQVEFFPDSEFFNKYEEEDPQVNGFPFPSVQVTGTAQLTDFNPTARRRNSRALQTQQTDSEFEMEFKLAKPEGTSGSITATVTRFALVGAAGAAILI